MDIETLIKMLRFSCVVFTILWMIAVKNMRAGGLEDYSICPMMCMSCCSHIVRDQTTLQCVGFFLTFEYLVLDAQLGGQSSERRTLPKYSMQVGRIILWTQIDIDRYFCQGEGGWE